MSPVQATFRHEALLYAGSDDFLGGTLPFLREGLAAEEPMLVVVDAAKIRALRAALGDEAGRVHFEDMARVGLNPARIIPAWRDFVDAHAVEGRQFRGIGEPICAERGAAELVECQRHESLLNVAFSGAPAWWLLCPYDTNALDPLVIDEARRSHPWVWNGSGHEPSDVYRGLEGCASYAEPLAEPQSDVSELWFGANSLGAVRRFAMNNATDAGLSDMEIADLVLVVNELATNSLRHGGGSGVLRMWSEGDALVCEVRDEGHVDQPLVGRVRPTTQRENGRGLWLANQLCDLVQLRTSPQGTAVRMHMQHGGRRR
jgi:anti-sigma regulatory factor (Ser/Thr protein kinase)